MAYLWEYASSFANMRVLFSGEIKKYVYSYGEETHMHYIIILHFSKMNLRFQGLSDYDLVVSGDILFTFEEK